MNVLNLDILSHLVEDNKTNRTVKNNRRSTKSKNKLKVNRNW